MRDSEKRNILRIIIAASKAMSEPNEANMKALTEVITDTIAPMNVAHAFALGLSLGSGGAQSNCVADVTLMIQLCDHLGNVVEEQRAAATEKPKGALLN